MLKLSSSAGSRAALRAGGKAKAQGLDLDPVMDYVLDFRKGLEEAMGEVAASQCKRMRPGRLIYGFSRPAGGEGEEGGLSPDIEFFGIPEGVEDEHELDPGKGLMILVFKLKACRSELSSPLSACLWRLHLGRRERPGGPPSGMD